MVCVLEQLRLCSHALSNLLYLNECDRLSSGVAEGEIDSPPFDRVLRGNNLDIKCGPRQCMEEPKDNPVTHGRFSRVASGFDVLLYLFDLMPQHRPPRVFQSSARFATNDGDPVNACGAKHQARRPVTQLVSRYLRSGPSSA